MNASELSVGDVITCYDSKNTIRPGTIADVYDEVDSTGFPYKVFRVKYHNIKLDEMVGERFVVAKWPDAKPLPVCPQNGR